MIRLGLAMLALVLTQLLSAEAQTQSLSGSWQVTTSPKQTWKIEQSPTGLTLRVNVDNQEVRISTWRPGGPAVAVSAGIGDAVATTTLSALGNQLVFEGPVILPSGPASIRESWTLDSTGKLLTVVRRIEGNAGTSFSRELLLQRQH